MQAKRVMRRNHSDELTAEAIQACRQPAESLAPCVSACCCSGGLIIVLIVTLARGFDGKSAGNEFRPREKTALDILGERYARGEVDRSEFEQRCDDLKGSGIITRDW